MLCSGVCCAFPGLTVLFDLRAGNLKQVIFESLKSNVRHISHMIIYVL
jgi:hypothetical protein